MWLTLTNDQGKILERWYIPDAESNPRKVKDSIEGRLPVYESKVEYEKFVQEP